MMQNYEDKSRKITQNWYDNYTFSEKNNKMTAVRSLHLAFDTLPIVHKSLLDAYIKCYTLCSGCCYKFRIKHFLR